MTDILKELFDSPFYSRCDPPEELRALYQRESELWEKLVPELSPEALDSLNAAQADIARADNLQWFREGFRLSASLMLHLL